MQYNNENNEKELVHYWGVEGQTEDTFLSVHSLQKCSLFDWMQRKVYFFGPGTTLCYNPRQLAKGFEPTPKRQWSQLH